MKIRQGFVSNSSSSSYIVHSSAIGENNFKKLIEWLQKYIENANEDDTESWGDSGMTFEVQDQYLFVELYNAPDVVTETFHKYVDDSDKAFHYYM